MDVLYVGRENILFCSSTKVLKKVCHWICGREVRGPNLATWEVSIRITCPISPKNQPIYFSLGNKLWEHRPLPSFMTCSKGKIDETRALHHSFLCRSLEIFLRKWKFWQPEMLRQNIQDSPYITDNVRAIPRNTAQGSIVLSRLSKSCRLSVLSQLYNYTFSHCFP